jgi:hypothetical protein
VNDPYLTAGDRYPSRWHWQALSRPVAAPPPAAPAGAGANPVLRTLAALSVILVLLLLA